MSEKDLEASEDNNNLGYSNKGFTGYENEKTSFPQSTGSNDQITYAWKNINVWAETNTGNFFGKKTQNPPKQILKNVNGMVKPGEFLAIMGASGAGKTTLLNLLTYRNQGTLKIEGERIVNGASIGPNTLTSLSGYVQQDDLFVGTLTVIEHLTFQSWLRMDKDIPTKKRMLRVEEVIKELGLTKCKDVMIGAPGRLKGISGGEMKRLAFASEVLTNPPILLADEPTSGLDSYMAQNVVTMLKNLAAKGKTIICTIHQPSSEVYALFDKLLLMSEGRTAFLGSANDATKFFGELNYLCPETFNPSDFFIMTLAIQPGKEEECKERSRAICDSYDNSSHATKIKDATNRLMDAFEIASINELKNREMNLQNQSPYKASWINQFLAVVWRSWITIVREPMALKARTIQSFLIPVILGLIYLRQDLDAEGVQNINGAVFIFLTNITFTNMLSIISVFCQELPIFLREHFNGMYRTDVYFLGKTVADIPLLIILPLIFISIYYWMVGLNPEWDRFIIACGITTLVANTASSFGYLISCFAKTMDEAMAYAPMFLIPLMIFGGFFLNEASTPVYLVWLKYLSWFLYGNEALAINQWDGVKINCPSPSLNSTVPEVPVICPPTGEAVLNSLNFEKGNFTRDILLLVALLIGYRFLAYLALLSKTFRKK